MKESEARLTWCPHVQVSSGTQAHAAFNNRGVPVVFGERPLCIASECSQWMALTSKEADAESEGSCGLIRGKN